MYCVYNVCIVCIMCVCVCYTVTLADLVAQVNDVVSSFSGDIYGIVDQTIGVSQGKY